jgi:VIT1/CCC1 family predicted Fe2+/Mn2+ transporter
MERSSFKASLVSGGLFLLGSLPAVVPFACTNVRNDAIIAASVCCCAMLFFVGAAKTKMTRANLWVGGFENMFYGAAGAAGFAFPFTRPLSSPKHALKLLQCLTELGLFTISLPRL